MQDIYASVPSPEDPLLGETMNSLDQELHDSLSNYENPRGILTSLYLYQIVSRKPGKHTMSFLIDRLTSSVLLLRCFKWKPIRISSLTPFSPLLEKQVMIASII